MSVTLVGLLPPAVTMSSDGSTRQFLGTDIAPSMLSIPMGLALVPGVGVLVTVRAPALVVLLSSIYASAGVKNTDPNVGPSVWVGSTILVEVEVDGGSNGLRYTWSKDDVVLGEGGPAYNYTVEGPQGDGINLVTCTVTEALGRAVARAPFYFLGEAPVSASPGPSRKVQASPKLSTAVLAAMVVASVVADFVALMAVPLARGRRRRRVDAGKGASGTEASPSSVLELGASVSHSPAERILPSRRTAGASPSQSQLMSSEMDDSSRQRGVSGVRCSVTCHFQLCTVEEPCALAHHACCRSPCPMLCAQGDVIGLVADTPYSFGGASADMGLPNPQPWHAEAPSADRLFECHTSMRDTANSIRSYGCSFSLCISTAHYKCVPHSKPPFWPCRTAQANPAESDALVPLVPSGASDGRIYST
jgi:hypothetical protein